MAVSAVYCRIAPITTDGSGRGDNFACANVSASQTFNITVPCLYRISVVGSSFGSVTLQQLGPDDSTYLTVTIQTETAPTWNGTATGTLIGAADSFTANGSGLVYLSAGKYKLALA